ncbi:Vacuolar protein sorting-associated protein 54, chloroplastic [Zancudomyces culisetae]|uniref:Vacuolar protein sorting-associated protein 54, chloroplastic n=1 Tax=Zancudomyces culisetae TaxID=1213189 RepID=A0A1R1PWT8_ZANCU|nr:Vacuolar protein sorting-associated protein 54, chloroplastic [Zancudomyces culisetae]|eukprot:OMH85397.1 Vacuolar protein sorting-associated protein 54, chloroplastic [Zancudomyces culisetae]
MDTIGTLVEDYYPEGFPKSGNGVDFNDAEVQQKLSQCVKAMTLDSYLYLFGKQSHALVLVNGYIQEISNLGAKVNEQNKMVTTSPELISAIRELASFTALLEMTTDYVEKMEKLRGKMSNNIKGQMIKVGKIYMGNYLVEKSRQINVIVENEQWNHVDAPKDYQELLDSLVSCSEANSVELENAQTTAKYLPLTSVTTKVSPTPQKSPMNRPSLNKLKIGESTFSMVGSSLTLLKIVYEYLQIALHVSFLFTQAVSDTSIIFKQFNSKVCQVVLGAGAVASAGLKVISAKHISLATNALDFALEVINLAQIILSNAAPSYKKLISDSFDLITFDYISHREELLKKLLSIMSERAKSHATALSNTDYDHLSSSPSSTALGITKELKRLYKILFRYLKYSDCVSTFRSIITEFDSTFQSCFEGDIQVTTAAGKLNIINDLRFINFELENLPGVPTLSDMLEITVNNINLVTDFLPSFSDQLYDEYLEYEAGYHPEVQGIDYIDIDSETTHSPSVDNSPYFP